MVLLKSNRSQGPAQAAASLARPQAEGVCGRCEGDVTSDAILCSLLGRRDKIAAAEVLGPSYNCAESRNDIDAGA
jgi:hypothetical protein